VPITGCVTITGQPPYDIGRPWTWPMIWNKNPTSLSPGSTYRLHSSSRCRVIVSLNTMTATTCRAGLTAGKGSTVNSTKQHYTVLHTPPLDVVRISASNVLGIRRTYSRHHDNIVIRQQGVVLCWDLNVRCRVCCFVWPFGKARRHFKDEDKEKNRHAWRTFQPWTLHVSCVSVDRLAVLSDTRRQQRLYWLLRHSWDEDEAPMHYRSRPKALSAKIRYDVTWITRRITDSGVAATM